MESQFAMCRNNSCAPPIICLRSLHESQQPIQRKQLIRDRVLIHAWFIFLFLSLSLFPLVHDHMSPTDPRSEALKFHGNGSSRIYPSAPDFSKKKFFFLADCANDVRRESLFTVPPQVRTKIVFTCATTFIYRRRDVRYGENATGNATGNRTGAAAWVKKKLTAYRCAREKKKARPLPHALGFL